MARRRHLDHSAGQLGPDHRKRFRPAQRDLRHDYQFIPNLDARVTSWEPNWYDNANGVPFIDGAFLEGFGEYTDTYDWTLSMNRGLNLTDNDKIVIMQPYPPAAPNTAAGQQQVNFFLGTYLLLKGNQTYLNIDYGGGVQYYPEYQLNLGTATTPLPSNVSSYLWNGVYRRDFQNGFVLVNPGSTTYTLNLGGTYQQVQGHGGGTMTDAQLDANGNYIGGSLTYQNVNSVTLAGGSAAIFLNPTSSSLTVATPAQAAANPVTGTSVGLSVLGQENGSDSGLTYTWSSSGPAGVTFSANGTNSAKNTTAAFVQAGSLHPHGHHLRRQPVRHQQRRRHGQSDADHPPGQPGLGQRARWRHRGSSAPPPWISSAFRWQRNPPSPGPSMRAASARSTAMACTPRRRAASAQPPSAPAAAATSASATVSVVASSGTATFVKQDTTTQGNWIGIYGSPGLRRHRQRGQPAQLRHRHARGTGELHLGRQHDRPEGACRMPAAPDASPPAGTRPPVSLSM